jgi:THO complex subunit 1
LRVGTDGAAFLRVVDTVLARDKNWVRWKEENCPEITRPAVLPGAFSKAATDGKTTWGWKRLRATPLGSLDLAFLSDTIEKNGVDRLLQSER